VLIFNYSSFSTNVSVKNLSQDIALAIRQAQTYATSVQSLPTGSSTDAFPTYGIAFSTATSGSNAYAPYQKRFVIFADIPPSGVTGDHLYQNGNACGTPANGNECLQVFSITSSDSIVQICPDGSCGSTAANIIFSRPAPDAAICKVSGSSCQGTPAYVNIVVQSAKGLQKTITVWNTGQISVQ
jgi:hypothetical protein